MRERHFMVDIETTGVNRESDKLLQVALVEVEYSQALGSDGKYWHPTGKVLDETLYYPGQPANEFAIKHMAAVYKKCNEQDPSFNVERLGKLVRDFIHEKIGPVTPKLFMGWNASNFDMPFLFDNKVLTPSYYESDPKTGKETLMGDAHYRIYEQTGSVQLICDMTGLDRKTIEVLAMDLNPTGLSLPKGKEHDAIFDCYKQIIMQNGLIKIGRMGIQK